MNPEDFDYVTHTRSSDGIVGIPKEELKNKMFDKIDKAKINQDMITGVLEELGSSANNWFYYFNCSHIQAFNPYLSEEDQKEIYDKERIVKRRLRLDGYAVITLAEEGFRLEDYEKCEPGEGLKLEWKRLPEILNEMDHLCTCWIGYPFMRGLIRSGNYLKPGEQKDENCDLDMSMYYRELRQEHRS